MSIPEAGLSSQGSLSTGNSSSHLGVVVVISGTVVVVVTSGTVVVSGDGGGGQPRSSFRLSENVRQLRPCWKGADGGQRHFAPRE